jgi:hypothetical protein
VCLYTSGWSLMIAGRAMATVESAVFGRWRLPLKAMDSCRKSQLSIVPLLLMWSAGYSLAWLLEEVVPAPPRPAALGSAPQYCHSRQSTSRDSIRWHCASFWRTVAAIVVHCAAVSFFLLCGDDSDVGCLLVGFVVVVHHSC